jgi:SAM-dependent methyltransferase
VGLYSRFVLPRILHLACSSRPAMLQREKIVPAARGRVLEIGICLNLGFYDVRSVEGVWGLDPSPEMTRMAVNAVARARFPVELISAGGEEIPSENGSFDTVLTTYTLCTIPDAVLALREMARVLKPGGQLLFCEHGLAPDADVRRWQDRVDPYWQRMAGGCHLNRDIPWLLEEGGFTIKRMETMYVPGWRPAGYTYWGAAAAL